MTTELPLAKEWDKRVRGFVEGDKVHADGDKLYVEAYKLFARSNKLYAETASGWRKAVIAKHGDITMEWKNGECHLGNGDVYIQKN